MHVIVACPDSNYHQYVKTPPAIEVAHLTKLFGAKKALDSVSFTVPAGSIFGFLGPNGAGKTTTIRCMMDFIRPSSGMITIFGEDSREKSTELKRKVGFLPSDLQLNPSWTVADHIRLAKNVRGDSTEYDRLIKLLGLDTRPRVRQLSTGNIQKLAIVLALSGKPELLIMDEPTKGLDPVLQNTVYDLLHTFAKRGNTVFFSSHNLAEVQRICDSVALIKDGKLITEQAMDEILGANVHIVNVIVQTGLEKEELVRSGAEILTLNGTQATFKIRGNLNPVMAYLVTKKILDLSIGHASLEDSFLDRYKEKDRI